MKLKIIEVAKTPYLYVGGAAPMEPELISKEMDKAFGHLMAFMETERVEPAGPPMAVYHDYDPNQMVFRAAIAVRKDDVKKVAGKVKADTLPGGRVHTFSHLGPYSKLRDTYEAAERELARTGQTLGIPTWEVYVNDPTQTPENNLQTDVFSVVAASSAS